MFDKFGEFDSAEELNKAAGGSDGHMAVRYKHDRYRHDVPWNENQGIVGKI